jgi:hypothetical protein
MSRIYSLSDDEAQIIEQSKKPGYGNVLPGYFFSKDPGGDIGWQFDANFDPDHHWQLEAFHATQPRIVVVGGFASGKTWWVAIDAACKALQYPDFHFISIAPTYKQSRIMYNCIIQTARGTPYEQLIFKSPESPMPMIALKFKHGNRIHYSTMEFWSGHDTTNMLTTEVDWLNIEQAESFDNLDDVLSDSASRARGSINGRTRLARVSMIANSGDNPTLWQQVDYAEVLPDKYKAYIIWTEHNKNVSDDQLDMMKRDVREDEQEQKFRGARPIGRGVEFSREHVLACESEMLDDYINLGLEQGHKGFARVSQSNIGVVEFALPRIDGHDYILIGDPGKGTAPYRNAPVWGIWDLDTFPFRLSAFWWGDGRGSLDPFVNKLFNYSIKYRPVYTGVDNTGPQSGTVEMINRLIHSEQEASAAMNATWQQFGQDAKDMQQRNISLFLSGMDFSGVKKSVYLMANQTMLSAGLLAWPRMVAGIRVQHLNYDRDKDRGSRSKLAQDIVSFFAMSSYMLAGILNEKRADEDEDENSEDADMGDYETARLARETRAAREFRANLRP